jgi:ATP-dependent DNA ligase
MQAMLVESIRPGEWIYEIKFDGYRAVALRGGNETRILSRNVKDLGRKFSEVKDAVARLGVQDAIIDGEIVALDDKGRSSFQLLQGFDMGLVRPPIVFYAFDLLRLKFTEWTRDDRLRHRCFSELGKIKVRMKWFGRRQTKDLNDRSAKVAFYLT